MTGNKGNAYRDNDAIGSCQFEEVQ